MASDFNLQQRLKALTLKNLDDSVQITSPISMIDRDHQFVMTQNGTLYCLGEAGQGKPPFDHLAMICAASLSCRYGTLFGIPHCLY